MNELSGFGAKAAMKMFGIFIYDLTTTDQQCRDNMQRQVIFPCPEYYEHKRTFCADVAQIQGLRAGICD